MKRISKELFIEERNGNCAFPGFVSYICRDEPVLIHRHGWEEENDVRDDWADMFSADNGRTWSDPVIVQKSRKTPQGKIRYAENSACYDPDTDQLIVMTTKGLYPNTGDEPDWDIIYVLETTTYDPVKMKWSCPRELDLGLGLAVSFTLPIKSKAGRLLFPACQPIIGPDGKPVHYRGCWAPAYQSMVVIGEYQPDGNLAWRTSQPVTGDLEKTCRGHDENTLIELSDGRMAMVIRGSNDIFPDRLGCKWVAFSDDGGLTWSTPQPWQYTDGQPVESSATGSALFRAIKNGKMYWMGNLCLAGQRARGNLPRDPILIAEVQEEPFALKRETITIIDHRLPTDTDALQLSNFRFYQDRDTGDVILFLTRFGEYSAQDWRRAGYYRYRIELS